MQSGLINMDNKTAYIRRYLRLKRRLDFIKQEHGNDTTKLTYHAGRNIGLIEGMLSVLDDVIFDYGIEIREINESDYL